MLLKSLKLENIRSYEHQEIIFPGGIILFEGDVGAGKSTILHAIEAALFGFSDISSDYLLRHGTSKGSIELSLDIDGRVYKFYREFTPGAVKKCWIHYPDERKHTLYTSEEMKKETLKLLKIKEKGTPRARVLTYRYAFFTPQEEMKTILDADEDVRIETLRRAFRIEEYKIAKENSEGFLRYLNRDIDTLKGQADGLEKKEEEKKAKECEISNLKVEIENLERELQTENLKLENLKKKKENLELLREEKTKLEREKTKINTQITEKERRKEDFRKGVEEAENAEKRVAELTPYKKRYDELKQKVKEEEEKLTRKKEIEKCVAELIAKGEQIEKEIEKIRKEIANEAEWRAKVFTLESEIVRIDELKNELNNLLHEIGTKDSEKTHIKGEISKCQNEKNEMVKISGAKICPKCKQLLSEEHVRSIIADLDKKIKENTEKFNDIEKEIVSLKSTEKWVLEKVNELEKKQIELTKLKNELERIEKMKKDVDQKLNEIFKLRREKEEKEKEIESISVADIGKIKGELSTLEKMNEEYVGMYLVAAKKSEYSEKLREISQEIEKLNMQSAEISKRLDILSKEYSDELYKNVCESCEEQSNICTKKQTKFDMLSDNMRKMEKDIVSLIEEVQKKRDAKIRAEKMERFSHFIKNIIVPALDKMEQHVLYTINQEFNEKFSDFLSVMPESSNISVSIDDKFSPVVTQGDYNQRVSNLSGGEKTAIALAYRLALNTVVKKECFLGSTNFLILDEPTDGFNKAQISKLREVFEKTNCDQIVIVSHEEEVESLVDKIFEVKKINGVSQIIGR